MSSPSATQPTQESQGDSSYILRLAQGGSAPSVHVSAGGTPGAATSHSNSYVETTDHTNPNDAAELNAFINYDSCGDDDGESLSQPRVRVVHYGLLASTQDQLQDSQQPSLLQESPVLAHEGGGSSSSANPLSHTRTANINSSAQPVLQSHPIPPPTPSATPTASLASLPCPPLPKPASPIPSMARRNQPPPSPSSLSQDSFSGRPVSKGPVQRARTDAAKGAQMSEAGKGKGRVYDDELMLNGSSLEDGTEGESQETNVSASSKPSSSARKLPRFHTSSPPPPAQPRPAVLVASTPTNSTTSHEKSLEDSFPSSGVFSKDKPLFLEATQIQSQAEVDFPSSSVLFPSSPEKGFGAPGLFLPPTQIEATQADGPRPRTPPGPSTSALFAPTQLESPLGQPPRHFPPPRFVTPNPRAPAQANTTLPPSDSSLSFRPLLGAPLFSLSNIANLPSPDARPPTAVPNVPSSPMSSNLGNLGNPTPKPTKPKPISGKDSNADASIVANSMPSSSMQPPPRSAPKASKPADRSSESPPSSIVAASEDDMNVTRDEGDKPSASASRKVSGEQRAISPELGAVEDSSQAVPLMLQMQEAIAQEKVKVKGKGKGKEREREKEPEKVATGKGKGKTPVASQGSNVSGRSKKSAAAAASAAEVAQAPAATVITPAKRKRGVSRAATEGPSPALTSASKVSKAAAFGSKKRGRLRRRMIIPDDTDDEMDVSPQKGDHGDDEDRVSPSPGPPLPSTSTNKKRKRSVSVAPSTASRASKRPNATPDFQPIRVFCAWNTTHHFPGAVKWSNSSRTKFFVEFDDGDSLADVPIEKLRKGELRIGDRVQMGRERAVVVDVSSWNEAKDEDRSVEVDIEAPSGRVKRIRATGKQFAIRSSEIAQEWKLRAFKVEELTVPIGNPDCKPVSAKVKQESKKRRRSLTVAPSSAKARTAPVFHNHPRHENSQYFSKKAFVITLPTIVEKEPSTDAEGKGGEKAPKDKSAKGKAAVKKEPSVEPKVKLTKAELTEEIQRLGGLVVDSWDDLYTVPVTGVKGKRGTYECRWEDVQWKDGGDIEEVLLVAETACQTAKYMMALALGIPCVSAEWVQHVVNGYDVDWRPFLLSAGKSKWLNVECSQWINPRWGRDPEFPQKVLDSDIVRKPFTDLSLLFLVKKDGPVKERSVVPSFACAAGASRVEIATSLTGASLAPSEFDYVVVADTESKAALAEEVKSHGAMCVDVAWVKQCVIMGTLQPVESS
ncbi:hypothetical protein BOTBODRAFT_27479 [Botryobasidium botryosum FD-172 SS1]|uniref:BRCT domain-containing protein n=1 Tax=Botryobasidium botryosum (strain FD-172 SS1) TaxID=930990 RepID=A0A067MWR8_BOTB1|nr:hypothetical protein BOTBODRAFT_27479 [Botryobasidium botryosum FD-172 SS1]